MNPGHRIELSNTTDLTGVIRWFISLRWIATAGVLAALLVSRIGYQFSLHYVVLLLLTSLLFLFNLGLTLYVYTYKNRNLLLSESTQIFHIQICIDYILLFLLLYLTGFVENPLAYYFVFHIMLTAFIFPKRTVFIYLVSVVLGICGIALLEFAQVLPHFSLREEAEVSYRALLGFRSFALTSTLLLTGYLITSIKEHLEERGQRVELELDKYKSLDREKSNFILQVTHELRGPLAALKGYHEMIIKGITGEISEKTQSTLGRANRRTQNLLNIIDEMIDFAYMKSEQEITRTLLDLNVREVIQHNLDLFATQARQQKVRLVSSCPRELSVLANRDLLNIILGNLITNAIKYSLSGGVVAINAEFAEGQVHMWVKDQGIGIAPDELEKIFEEFYRTRKAREIENDGTGLGLSIVQKTVNLLKGSISVYSEVDRGTTFHIYFSNTRNQETSPGGDND